MRTNHVLRDFNYVILWSFCMLFRKMLYAVTYEFVRDQKESNRVPTNRWIGNYVTLL